MKIETMTLTAFLLARVEEDAAFYAHYDVEEAHRIRLLAECEAKRRIVEDADVADRIEDDLGTAMERDRAWPYVGERILRALAAVYADHPDYRPEWRH